MNDIGSIVWDLGDIALRSVISLAVLFMITRMMGKKQISQLTFFDYVIGISIGSISAELAFNNDIPYSHGLIAVAIYGVIAILISVLTNKRLWARRFFTGRAFILIDKGKILEENLTKVRYDINDLLAEARNSGYFNISDIEYAVMETNGKLSFLPKEEKSPPLLEDLGIQKKQEGLVANVIIDGKVMRENLQNAGLNEDWLKQELKKQHFSSIHEIILATADNNNALTVFPRTHKPRKNTPMD